MPIEDDDDIDDNDLDDPADDDDPADASARARQIVADLEARQEAARDAPPGMDASEFLDASQELLNLVEQDLQSDDPETVRRAAAMHRRYEAINRQRARNRPGRIA
jgi:hypothetical protein